MEEEAGEQRTTPHPPPGGSGPHLCVSLILQGRDFFVISCTETRVACPAFDLCCLNGGLGHMGQVGSWFQGHTLRLAPEPELWGMTESVTEPPGERRMNITSIIAGTLVRVSAVCRVVA